MKKLLILLWFLVLISGPLTVFLVSPSFPRNITNTVYYLQRITGLLAFSILTIQIILGSRMNWFAEKLGGKVYPAHIFQAFTAYSLVAIHFVSELYMHTSFGKTLVSFIFPDLTNRRDLYVSVGKIAFLLITTTISTAYFRTTPTLRRLWGKVHILNYAAFYFYAYHAFKLGSDVKEFPFSVTFFASVFVVTCLLVGRFLTRLPVNISKIIPSER